MTGIPSSESSDDVDHMYALLADAGALIVHGLATAEQVAAVRSDLAPHVEAATAAPDNPEDFYSGHTHRVTALMHRSPTARDLMMHPIVEAMGERHLTPNCKTWTLNVSAALEVGPGARDQILHREEDLYPFFELPRPNLILASMWAMSDFTIDNGGTQIVPGSHTWPADRKVEPQEIVRAEMPAGSVLFWLGGVLHGAGANVTDDEWRYGMILTYNLSFLRQEENQHVSMPLADALQLPPGMQARLGFGQDNGDGLGLFDPRPVLGL
ncbi:MAG: phytanoyl-CoA dioxygenase family protein [Acidimicrobiales bacterium]|nr:phytanoyl-CoA dioxygenase family protein [Acidimicrobiales bacterium]MDG1876988.1 phytanoyl-CoA dioxygenase family protein [Acidimicrobiales bacterium]